MEQPVRIKPSTPEDRQGIYQDVIESLTVGFLAQSVSVGGVPLSLRTLNTSDFYLNRHRCGPGHTMSQWNNWILATAVWMLDGQVLLEDPGSAYEVYRMCSALPWQAKLTLLGVLKDLMIRLNEAVQITEAFCYERESRVLWKTVGQDAPKRAGIPGVDRLGMSTPLRIWTAYNISEDSREQWLSDWTRTKLLASTQAPKGIKKLNASDEAAMQQEDRRRQSVLDRAYYKVAKGIDLDVPEGGDGRYQDIRMAVTPEELEDEMRKVRAGEKDQHDLVVDFYKKKVRDRIEKERESQRKRVERVEREMEAAGVNEPALRPMLMSGEDVQRQLERKHVTRVYSDNKGNALYDKYIKEEPVVGSVSVPKDGLPVAMPTKPSDGSSTLQEQVEQRKPTLKGGS